jgi:SAM-dependent methyltransferase
MTPNSRTCLACGERGTDLASEVGRVRSNVRAFLAESFALWRCRLCASIHAQDEVDLDHYYSRYPFHSMPDDWRLRALYENQLRRLRSVGVRPEHRILDYGCGTGGFLRHLQRRGYQRTFGYDRYSSAFSDGAVLAERYDCVLSQDVLEHVAEPSSFLDLLHHLVSPGGLIALGTPNAEAISLDRHTHALHAPYHRHIFSRRALHAAGNQRGWRLQRYYPTQYANTLVPFLNSRFYLHYLSLCDDSLDSLMEPPRLAPLMSRLPTTLFWGLFGSFFAQETDVMLIFRRQHV